MVKRFVYGSYATIEEVERAVSELRDKGVPSEAVTLVGDETILSKQRLPYKTIYSTNLEGEHAERKGGFWDTIFGIFGAEDNQELTESNESIRGYQESLNRQEILLAVDQEYEERVRKINTSNKEERIRPASKENVEGSEKVKLHEEQLKPGVREDKSKSGNVRVHKNVVEDTETVDVPVRNEKVDITHHDTDNEKDVSDNAFHEEVIDVHVSREEPVVDRETVVRDEVDIDKTNEVDHEQIKGKTREEVIDVEDDRNLKNDKE